MENLKEIKGDKKSEREWGSSIKWTMYKSNASLKES